jgi:hypothetical protein
MKILINKAKKLHTTFFHWFLLGAEELFCMSLMYKIMEPEGTFYMLTHLENKGTMVGVLVCLLGGTNGVAPCYLHIIPFFL